MIFYIGSKRYRWRFCAIHPLLQGLMIILGTLAAARTDHDGEKAKEAGKHAR